MGAFSGGVGFSRKDKVIDNIKEHHYATRGVV
jgi:hypothetical protein